MKIVFVIGPACSGKSTYIKNNYHDYNVIDLYDFQKGHQYATILDSYEKCKEALIESIKEGKDTVMEHTLLREIRRKPYIDAIREITDAPIDIIVMKPSHEEFDKRCRLRGFDGATDDFDILEIPTINEGYNEIKIIE